MIKDKKPLSMAEANEILGSLKETDKINETKAFIKKYSKADPKKVNEFKEAIEKLDILKLKTSDIAKIIDLLPEDAQEINKLFTEVTLDADETNKIIDTVKKYK